MLKELRREESVQEQIYGELKEELRENLFWVAGETYVAIYVLDEEVVADIGGRQQGSFSPEEQYFSTVQKGIYEDSDVAQEWNLIDENGDEDEEAIGAYLKEVMEYEIRWGRIEKLAERVWKEYDEEQ